MNQTLSQQTKDLLSKHNLRLKRSLGQNLMIDPAAIQRIIDAAELTKDDTVIEIGTGTGLLTKELAKVAKRVITFEVDRKIVEAAKDYLADCWNVDIINEDFLNVTGRWPCLPAGRWPMAGSEKSIPATGHRSPATKIVANIPYYITSPIIEKLISVRTNGHLPQQSLSLAVLTVQREFAERISAKPGTKEYGSFTVFMKFYCEAELVSFIPKTSFMPQPDIGSAIIRLKFREKPPVEVKDEKLFFEVVRVAFGQRRKTLKKALSAEFEKTKVEKALEKSGIDPVRRGETLSIDEFATLANNL
jgi:16S rRNA (adenine1518-N6/adenine1519-N6)-dimethyltransferase